MTREEMKAEAIERMKLIKLSKQCIKAFEHGRVWTSECGMLYDDDKVNEMVAKFEAEYPDDLVYHVDHTVFEFGDCYAMFIVGSDSDTWEDDRFDLEDGYAFCYVYNVTDEWCSEFGSIAFKSIHGGVMRIG